MPSDLVKEKEKMRHVRTERQKQSGGSGLTPGQIMWYTIEEV